MLLHKQGWSQEAGGRKGLEDVKVNFSWREGKIKVPRGRIATDETVALIGDERVTWIGEGIEALETSSEDLERAVSSS